LRASIGALARPEAVEIDVFVERDVSSLPVAYNRLLRVARDWRYKAYVHQVAFLGLGADQDTIGRAAATIERSLRHRHVDYDPSGLPRGVARCRRELLRRAATET
jgi:hypothetical protein